MSKQADMLFVDLLSISTMTLATIDPNGNPHAAPVYFVSVNKGQHLHFYFFSHVDSQHSQHINQNPQTAAAIYPECRGWQEIKGLQMRGDARLVDTREEWDAGWEQYQHKFPFVRSLKPVIVKNQMYVYVPNWIRLVDNSKGFGYKKEWILS